MSENIKFMKMKEIAGTASDDGQYGLFKFVRETSPPNGLAEFWVGVPVALMPYMAALSIKMYPQPKPGLNAFIPAILKAQETKLSFGPDGQIALTLTIEQGAQLTFEIDRAQATSVFETLGMMLGVLKPSTAPPGSRN